ncbi:MAG: SDR family oxidoreductase [Betaproteobacteria bacterium]|nr:MAG: SDR family oxidoreductase [Betaproteobacteria bacterium]
MLGHTVLRFMAAEPAHEVIGVVRSELAARSLIGISTARIVAGGNIENPDVLVALFESLRPDVVVNGIGLVKQFAQSEDPLVALPINAIFPHRLAKLCSLTGARLVHISTDCVFSGDKGGYREEDAPDARDLYGRSKLLGEVDYPHAVTLRTSIIGHELNSAHGLIGWFLAQQGNVKGYTRAIFSGLPTCELARVIRDLILPRAELHGLYHVASHPISKYDLLHMVNHEYGKGLKIEPDDNLKIDRSLNANRFLEATGYIAPNWPDLIAQMREFR